MDATETKAREMGWVSKEEFRGDPEKHIDAESYVKRGEDFIPILRKNNERLLGQLGDTNRRLTEALEAVDVLKKHDEQMAQRAYEKALKDLREEKVVALKAGDAERVVALEDQIDELKKPEAAPPPPAPAPGVDPAYLAWVEENPWMKTDNAKAAYAASMARFHAATTGLKGRELLDKVADEVKDRFGEAGSPPPPPPPRSRVEGGTRGTSRGGKSFADAPAEDRAACDRIGSRLVGEGKAFKTQAEWRAKWAADYFAE